MDWLTGTPGAPLLGLLGGVLLGLAARRGRFCTLGAIEDALYGHDLVRLRMWALALAVAIAGTAVLVSAGAIDLSASLYARVAWNPVASIVGGLTFGYGMAIAGNCGYGALARLGGGDLRALVLVVVMGVAAYAVLSGPLSHLRLMLFPPAPMPAEAPMGFGTLADSAFRGGALVLSLVAASALALWAFKDAAFRARASSAVWAVVVGVAIVTGWLGTSYLAGESFEVVPVQSHTFTAPLGETLMFLMTGSSGGPGFAVGSVTGVILGSVIGCLSKGHFRWEACDDPQELGRQILGGALMGIGGVLALGCSIGQGLTAFSALTFSAPVVLVCIFIGAALGLRHLIRGFEAA